MPIRFSALPTDAVRALQSGKPDAYGMVPEQRVSDGDGVPCRHCLKQVPRGAGYLVMAYRPFPSPQPYAETGPIFLCADPCQRALETDLPPEILASASYILRGYSAADRIVYGTGRVVPTAELTAAADALLAHPGIAYAHVRSAANNCYQVRIDRA